MTRIGVVGALGRMGSEACRAIGRADDLTLAAVVSPSHAGQPLGAALGIESDLVIAEDLDALVDARVDVAVELTGPETVGPNLLGLLDRGIDVVVGSSGLGAADLAAARERTESGDARALIVPNFAIGAVLLMQAAEQIAAYLPDVEIIELHHDGKRDAPSGTALRTAEVIARARDGAAGASYTDPPPRNEPRARGEAHHGVPIHSVRLPGLVAHQEVVFGGEGQTLSLRHDSLDRTSFMPGLLLACRRVGDLEGLAVGLEHVL